MQASPTPQVVEADVAIVGGGVAGLWLLNRLRQAGYSTVLVEKTALGSGQTIASQGMIHGGLKYALAGSLTGESEAIKQMPGIWQDCLAGTGEINLGQTRVLSEDFYLWSSGQVASRLVSFFASKSLRGRIDKVKPKAYPSAFAGSPYKGTIYRLQDVVLDVPSLLENLAGAHRPFITQSEQSHWEIDDSGVSYLQLDSGARIVAQRYVVTAGEGAGPILDKLGISQPAMQLRPLKQVMVKHRLSHRLYGHCIGTQTSASPRLTVSTHQHQDGNLVWYLGGDLATEGVNRSDDQLITHAKAELASIFPWLDFSDASWACHYIDRAEPRQDKLLKPDSAFAAVAEGRSNTLVAWPTKLTLAPDLAQRTLALLQGTIEPRPMQGRELLERLPKPAIATPPWEQSWQYHG